MSDPKTTQAAAAPPAAWGDLFRDGRTLFTVLVILGTALHALQILVIAIIMPTVVADIGGAAFYTWPAMIYTLGSIVGAASVGPVWSALGPRRGYAISGAVLLLGTTGCALAPDMGSLIAARTVQGFGGGLVVGGSMALVSGLFSAGLRTRILALYQGTWMVAQMLGPVVGGAFAEFGWWRGSFWSLVPIILCFSVTAWFGLPDRFADDTGREPARGFPVARLMLLGSGIFCIALAGPVAGTGWRVALVTASIALLWVTFRLDRTADNRLYPSGAISPRSPVGLALWILFFVGLVQTSVTVFLPLLLQVVYEVTPLFISFVTIVISLGWTVGTFSVTRWSGAKERFALWGGPLFMIAGMAVMAMTARFPMLVVLTAGAFVLGYGIGTHNIHLLARTMAAADEGEERITAAAMPALRSLGTAFGAASAGMLSAIAGLDNVTEPGAVGNAVTVVYAVNLVPLVCVALLMFRLVSLGRRGG